MKKVKFISILLSLILLVQCMELPVSAAQVAESQPEETSGLSGLLTQTEEVPFGKVCVENGCRTIEGKSPLAGSAQKLSTAQSVFLYETTTGTVVYSYNPDVKVAPGNLAKLVNAAVVLQHAQLDDVVKVTGDIHRRPAGSQHAGLKTDEELTVKDLLYSMILTEANDSAIALAVHVAGNQQGFATLMNNWVAQLGCEDTRFGNVHGLDNAECTTTAREMVKIYMAVMENPDLYKILSAGSYEHPATNKNEKYSFRTHNYMIDEGIIPQFKDDRVKSGIVGFNQAMGASIVVSAESKHEDEAKKLKYVAVVLNAQRTFAENGWSTVSWGNFNELSDLLKMGFDGYKKNRILYNGMAVSQFTVAGGECNAVGEVKVDVDSVVPANAQMDNLVMNFKVSDGGLAAPIKAGDQIATMQVEYRGSIMTEAEVYAVGNVQKAENNGITIHTTETKKDSGGSGFLSTVGTICVIGLGVAAVYLAFNAYMRNRIRARHRRRRAERRRNR